MSKNSRNQRVKVYAFAGSLFISSTHSANVKKKKNGIVLKKGKLPEQHLIPIQLVGQKKNVVYYELLPSNVTVNTEVYCKSFCHFEKTWRTSSSNFAAWWYSLSHTNNMKKFAHSGTRSGGYSTSALFIRSCFIRFSSLPLYLITSQESPLMTSRFTIGLMNCSFPNHRTSSGKE